MELLIGILITLGVIIILLYRISNRNIRSIKKNIDDILIRASREFTINKVQIDQYQTLKVKGILKFKQKQYEIKDYGNLLIMTTNAGLMQMATIVFTPYFKDVPLLSVDYIYILGNRKAIIEFYDLVTSKDELYHYWIKQYKNIIENYHHLQDTTASTNWYDYLLSAVTYKAGKSKDDIELNQLLQSIIQTYFQQILSYPLIQKDKLTEKKLLIKEYSDRLISEGGISTDVFKSSLGNDNTREFFDQVFFGSGIY